jgi:hypothetical protein
MSANGMGVIYGDPAQAPSASAQGADDQFERQFFNYVLDIAVVGNAVQSPLGFQVLSDADFELWWLIASRTSNLLKLLWKEAATGRDFISTTASVVAGAATFNGINIDNFAGTALATAAFPLAVPYILPANRSYTFLLTDTSGATNTVQLVLSGFKLWPRPKVGS